MNYFAHGRRFLADPYFVAGTAVPDWLNVVNRRVKARGRRAAEFVADPDPPTASLARGIVQHHHDDRWFHQTQAFAELSLQFTVELRDRLDADGGFRPSFLGHILVELLLDDVLIQTAPAELDRYYQVIDSLDPTIVNRIANRMTTSPTGMLEMLIPRFSSERFLYDYADNGKLLVRLNHVMRRVKLPAIPSNILEFLPTARRAVRARRHELLDGETSCAGESNPSSSSSSGE